MGAEAAYIGLILAAVGQGVQYEAQQDAAKTQSNFSVLNMQAQMAQASMQSKLATSQASLSAQQARNRERTGQQQANAARDQAEQVARISRINIGREMENQARVRSAMLARSGASGTVAGEGSQLDLLVEAASLATLENTESAYQANIAMRQLYRQAEGAQIGADEYGIQTGIELMQGEARASAARAAGVQANIRGLAGIDTARGASMSALGGAISGFGSLAFKGYDLGQQGAFG